MTSIPNYVLRESTKAKRVRIEVSPHHVLVVVVPKGFDQTQIPALVESKQAWIEKSLRRVNQRHSSLEPGLPGQLPQRILLLAIGEGWAIQNQPTEAFWVAAVEKIKGTLLVCGNVDNTAAYLAALRRWLNKKSHDHLVPWLQKISEEEGLPFGRTLVKSQRTRWASCSRHKTISINQNLLFVPSRLVHYVFIHELCHTLHLNHSSKFWALVSSKEPDYLELRKELRTAWRWVPAWIENGCTDARASDLKLEQAHSWARLGGDQAPGSRVLATDPGGAPVQRGS